MSAIVSSATFADYSALSTLAECPERYRLSIKERWIPKRTNISLHAGRAGHVGLYELYASDWDLDAALEAMYLSWGSVTPPPEKAHLTAGHMEVVLRNYAEDRRGDAIRPYRFKASELDHSRLEHFAASVDDDGCVVFAETPLAVRFWVGTAEELVYAGLIDLPVELHGELYIVDHKFTGRWVSERWAQTLAQRYQLRGYAAMLEAATGKRVAGAFINGVYMGREAVDDKAKWAKRTSRRSGLFGPYVFAPHDLDGTLRWARDLMQAREFYESSGIWPRNDRACEFCQFRSVCWGNPALATMELKRNFVQRPFTGILASGADSPDE